MHFLAILNDFMSIFEEACFVLIRTKLSDTDQLAVTSLAQLLQPSVIKTIEESGEGGCVMFLCCNFAVVSCIVILKKYPD